MLRACSIITFEVLQPCLQVPRHRMWCVRCMAMLHSNAARFVIQGIGLHI
jgi:hypothetical protein